MFEALPGQNRSVLAVHVRQRYYTRAGRQLTQPDRAEQASAIREPDPVPVRVWLAGKSPPLTLCTRNRPNPNRESTVVGLW